MGNLLSSESEGPKEKHENNGFQNMKMKQTQKLQSEQVIDYNEVRERFRKKKRGELSIKSEGNYSHFAEKNCLDYKLFREKFSTNQIHKKTVSVGRKFYEDRNHQSKRKQTKIRPNRTMTKSVPGKIKNKNGNQKSKEEAKRELKEMVDRVSQIEHLLII